MRLFAFVFALLCSVAQAQEYPTKPVRMLVPFAPGGAVDTTARVLAQAMQARVNWQFVVENRPGGNGFIATTAVAKSAPDGYTLLIGNIASLAMNVGVYPKMTYHPVKDFTPIIRTVAVNYVMAVHPSVPARSVAEFIAYAKANPGKLSYGSAGSGSAPHLATELFKQRTGIDVLHVPFKGGGPMVTDLLGGQVQMVIADQANLMPQVKAGRLRALGVGTLTRSPAYPELPTLAESGLPGFEARAWQGVVGPAGMSADTANLLNAAFGRVMAMPDVHQRLLDGGLDPIPGTRQEFGDFIRDEIAKWAKVAKDVGARVE